MKENYVCRENIVVPEFKSFEAEEYYKNENGQIKNENFFSESENSVELDKLKLNISSDDNTSKTASTAKVDVSDEISKIENLTQNVTTEPSLTNTIMQAAGNVVTTVATTVAGAAGVVALVTSAITSQPVLKVKTLELGADYVSYTFEIDDLQDDIPYYIMISNGSTSHRIDEVTLGEMTGIVTGLKPFSKYNISLETYTDLGPTVFSEYSFVTLRDESPKASISYTCSPSLTDSSVIVDYEIYVSDKKNTGSNFYVQILNDEEIIYENELVKNFNSSSFNIPNDTNITFIVYATVYDEIELIGNKDTLIHVDTPYSEPTYTWSEDNSKVTASITSNISKEVITETITPTLETITEPTCTIKGVAKLTAVFSNSLFETQTKNIDLDPLGHDYSFTYNWLDDDTKVEAIGICSRDENHKITEISELTKTIDTNDQDEKVFRFNTSFENELFKNQYKDYPYHDLSSYEIESIDISQIDMMNTLDITLNNYDPDVSYTIELLYKPENTITNEINVISKKVTIEEIGGNILDYEIHLKTSYLDEDKTLNKDINDFVGLNVSFDELIYDESLKKYVIPFTYSINENRENILNAYLLSSDSSTVSETSIEDNKIILSRPPSERFKVVFDVDSFDEENDRMSRFEVNSPYYNVTYSLNLDEIAYEQSQYDGKILFLKPYIFAPEAYSLKIKINNEEEIEPLTNINVSEGYYRFNVSSIDSGTVSYYLSDSENNKILENTFTLDFTLDLEMQGSMTSPNPSDCAKTFNEDGSINLYIPVEATFTNENEFGRVKLYTPSSDEPNPATYLIDVKEGSLALTNINNSTYSLNYYHIKTINGINYITQDTMPSGSIDNTYYVNAWKDTQNKTITFYDSYSPVSKCTIIFEDGSEVEYNLTDNPDNDYSYMCTYTEDKEPLSVTFVYEKVNTMEGGYWPDEKFTEYGLTKSGTYAKTLTLILKSN